MGRCVRWIAVLMLLGVGGSAFAQAPRELVRPDSLPSPTGALYRSLAVPGWGQAYNGEWYKVPIVVGGLAGLGYGVWFSQDRTVLFRRAAIFLDCQSNPESVPPGTCDDAARFASAFERADALAPGPLSANQARNQRDGYRRQRDMLIGLTIIAYGLQALDAYVAAELADFDVSEDLSLRVGASPTAVRLTFRLGP